MKVLLINTSTHENGTGAMALSRFSTVLATHGIDTELHTVSEYLGLGCTACRACHSGGGCRFGDITELSESFRSSVGLVVSAPVYYGSPSGYAISLLDRLFQSSRFDKRMKVGAAIVTARRGGCTASLDVINKYFSISEMPIATSSYWSFVHTGEDPEGIRTVDRLAENLAQLVQKIAGGR